jgi:hypothetical protein
LLVVLGHQVAGRAAQMDLQPEALLFALERANTVLLELKAGKIRGAKVWGGRLAGLLFKMGVSGRLTSVRDKTPYSQTALLIPNRIYPRMRQNVFGVT